MRKTSKLTLFAIAVFLMTASTFINGQQDSVVLDVAATAPINVAHIALATDAGNVYLYQGEDSGSSTITINGEATDLTFDQGKAVLPVEATYDGELLFLRTDTEMKLVHLSQTKNGHTRLQSIPLWLSLLPPLIAIALALLFKEVVISLFMGIWSGAFIAGGLRWDSPFRFILSFFDTVQKYIMNALADTDHLSVILFSLLIGGMVAIISKNGGMAGVVSSFSKYANSAKNSQLITWLLGVLIFFDDYANTLIVGNTMRSVTDKHKVSREKLAYIVDSTAAPVAAVAFITTWIGAELGYIGDGMAQLDLSYTGTAYSIFFSSLKYSFYPILTLIFILIIIYTGKDYGPMHRAELRARTTGQVSSAATTDEDEPNMEDLTPVDGAPRRWWHAAVPVLTVILVTIYGLLHTGFESLSTPLASGALPSWGQTWAGLDGGFFTKLGTVIGDSNSYTALIWASLAGVVIAILITVSSRIMKLFDTIHWMTAGFKTMIPAVIILTLAWSLAITTKELHTADYLSTLLTGSISPYLLSALVFLLAAFIAFSTGSSWSTMAILYPIAIPTTYAVCSAAGMAEPATMEILLSVIATVLAASVLGDHCSPISDTTILSSLASDCNHLDHVKTQLPYALTVGGFSLSCVVISSYLGGGLLLSILLLGLSTAGMYLIVQKLGQTSE